MTVSESSHNIKLIGLTGSSGSGKSAVAEIFKDLGAYIIDADVLAREVIAIGTKGYEELRAYFDDSFFDINGNLIRRKLGEFVYSNTVAKQQLENIIHPKIRALVIQKINDAKLSQNHKYSSICYVVPLLFEKNIQKSKDFNFDLIISVTAKDELKIARLIKRDRMTKDIANARLSNQLPDSKKASLSDIVITNNGTLKELEQNCKQIYANITND